MHCQRFPFIGIGRHWQSIRAPLYIYIYTTMPTNVNLLKIQLRAKGFMKRARGSFHNRIDLCCGFFWSVLLSPLRASYMEFLQQRIYKCIFMYKYNIYMQQYMIMMVVMIVVNVDCLRHHNESNIYCCVSSRDCHNRIIHHNILLYHHYYCYCYVYMYRLYIYIHDYF